MAVVVLVLTLRLRNLRVCLFVLAKNRPVGCPKVAHEITLASKGPGTLTCASVLSPEARKWSSLSGCDFVRRQERAQIAARCRLLDLRDVLGWAVGDQFSPGLA